MSRLTEKQQRFADEYIKSGNATESARLAGYSPRTAKSIGQENLTKPDIKSYINKRLKELESKRIMDAQEALELLTEIARGEMKETTYMSSPLGVEEVTKFADINQRKDALKEILKRYPLGAEDAKRLSKAQADKATAEARLAESKAEALENMGVGVELVIVDEWSDEDEEVTS